MHADAPRRGDLVPVTAIAVIAVVGAATLFFMNSDSQSEVPRNGITMITASVVGQAGAIALPTQPAR